MLARLLELGRRACLAQPVRGLGGALRGRGETGSRSWTRSSGPVIADRVRWLSVRAALQSPPASRISSRTDIARWWSASADAKAATASNPSIRRADASADTRCARWTKCWSTPVSSDPVSVPATATTAVSMRPPQMQHPAVRRALTSSSARTAIKTT
ncbi:hypothetical protein AB0393_38025 [Streptomyces cyaneofuscatus]|uniref:hypothetical protein n=1 Tax=Streptomyces cyaneofuscatus TaxID=66883 RepID=UPI00344B4EB3